MSPSLFTRRRAIRSIAALGACSAIRQSFAADASESGLAGQPTPANASIRLGAQTNAWPIDPRSFDTFLSALHEVRETGYGGFETGFINLRSQARSLPEARKRIEESGLKFIGIHIFLPEYDANTNIASPELYEVVAQTGAATGAERLIFSGAPSVTPDEIKRKGDALNKAGAYAKTLGLKVAYHNHRPEFKYNGKEIEAIYKATDPALVWFLLDAGHAYRTGIDLPEFLKAHQQRITAIHFRDYRDHQQVPLGQGTVPLAQIVDVLKQAKWSGWVMNEEEREDGSKQGLKVMQPAFQALKEAFSA